MAPLPECRTTSVGRALPLENRYIRYIRYRAGQRPVSCSGWAGCSGSVVLRRAVGGSGFGRDVADAGKLFRYGFTPADLRCSGCSGCSGFLGGWGAVAQPRVREIFGVVPLGYALGGADGPGADRL